MVKKIGRIIRYIQKIIFAKKQIKKYSKSKMKITGNPCLFITHNLGGGTENFVSNFLKEHNKENIYILRNLSYVYDLCYVLEEVKTGEKKGFKNFEEFCLFISNVKWKKILINSLVSYYNWDKLLSFLRKLKKQNREILIEYFLHDFHCICPGRNLIKDNNYCNLNCKNNNCSFDKHAYTDYIDIRYWHTKWQLFFDFVDTIYSFSESSKEIFLQIYRHNNIQVRPHSMDYCHFKPIKLQKQNLHIGIVGTIKGAAKGCYIVREFLELCKKNNICVTVVGELQKDCIVKGDNILITGKYKISELGHILEENGINAIFFTSICPETFSYLVSELMFLDIPIFSFNIGAQGEKIRNYEKGMVFPLNTDISHILEIISNYFYDHN